MAITLDPKLAHELEHGMDTGGGVELPFVAPYIWVVNGDAKLKQLGGALYFGGWLTKAEDMLAICEQKGLNVPTGFIKQSVTAKNSDDFEGYTARHVIVAPMGVRTAWLKDGMHSPKYVAGARRHVQVLCLLASKQGQNGTATYLPWGPAVLTAKGYQALNVLAAFKDWDKHTKNLRQKVAPGVPAWCFYLAVGTFGDKPETKTVGKTSTSPITPITAYLPKELTEKTMEQLFVTEPIAQLMTELRQEADTWLEAWNEPVRAEGEDTGVAGPEMPPDPPEEELPF